MMIDCSVLVVGVREYFCFPPRKTLPKNTLNATKRQKLDTSNTLPNTITT